MKRVSVYKIIFLFLIAFIYEIGYSNNGNTNTKDYCLELVTSAKKEYFARDYVKSLETLTKLQPIVKENKFVDLEIVALNLTGLIYIDLLDYDKAMEYFLEGYDLATKSHELKSEVAILCNMAIVYQDNKEYDKVLAHLKKAYDVSLKLDDNIRTGEVAVNIASIALIIEDLALAEQYLTIATKIQIDDERFHTYVRILTIQLLLYKKEYSKAESMAKDILQKNIIPGHKLSLYFLLSKISQNKGDLEKAIYYIDEILKEEPNLKEKLKAYEQLSELYQENNSFAPALQYKDSVIQVKDSLYRTTNKQYLEVNRIQMELLNSEKQLTKNKAKQRVERILFISIIAFIAILAIVFIWVFRIQSIRNKQRKQITELELGKEKHDKLLLEKQLNEQETLALLEQERLNNEHKEKLLLKRKLKEQEALSLLEQERLNNENKQLAAKVLLQSGKNELTEEIIDQLSKIPKNEEIPGLQSIIQQLKTRVQGSKEMDGFLTYFEQINPVFLSSLKKKHPDLTISDIRLLSYIYLNLNIQEIASLLSISISSCKKKKQRLAAKMGIPTADLYAYLAKIK